MLEKYKEIKHKSMFLQKIKQIKNKKKKSTNHIEKLK